MNPPVHVVTDAPVPLSVEQKRRVRTYVLAMTLRVVCFLGAIVVDGPTRWLLVAAAVVLPYGAVVAANSAGKRR